MPNVSQKKIDEEIVYTSKKSKLPRLQFPLPIKLTATM